jgi:hypothetical protein
LAVGAEIEGNIDDAVDLLRDRTVFGWMPFGTAGLLGMLDVPASTKRAGLAVLGAFPFGKLLLQQGDAIFQFANLLLALQAAGADLLFGTRARESRTRRNWLGPP